MSLELMYSLCCRQGDMNSWNKRKITSTVKLLQGNRDIKRKEECLTNDGDSKHRILVIVATFKQVKSAGVIQFVYLVIIDG